MKVYLVGGAVRDEILGRPVHDRDYVVVGSTHDEMISLGYKPVGNAFPVYLHPETGEEYALARTERKTGVGHTGFEVRFTSDVTLEEDLYRRDLTINAIAKDLETGEYIDPYGGLKDIDHKRLKHVSHAFSDDPLRILRVWRLQAQLGADWGIDAGTGTMIEITKHRLEEISPERQWKEMEKALHSNNFKQYAEHLAKPTGGLGWHSDYTVMPELAVLRGVEQPPQWHPEGDAYIHTIRCLEECDYHSVLPTVKFAVLCHDLGKRSTYDEFGNLHGHEQAGKPIVEALCNRLKVPTEYRNLAMVVTEHHTRVHCIEGRNGTKDATPGTIYKLLVNTGSLKDAGRAHDLATACYMDMCGRGEFTVHKPEYNQFHKFLFIRGMVGFLDTKAITKAIVEKKGPGIHVGVAVEQARIRAVGSAITEFNILQKRWKDHVASKRSDDELARLVKQALEKNHLLDK